MNLHRIAKRLVSNELIQKTVYHRTASFWSLKNLIESDKFEPIVNSKSEIGNRLSTSKTLSAAMKDWAFGAWILEISVELPNDSSREISTEIRIYESDPHEFTRWGIVMGRDESSILWFDISDIGTFNHKHYDDKVLGLIFVDEFPFKDEWAMDFFGGVWSKADELDDIVAENILSKWKKNPRLFGFGENENLTKEKALQAVNGLRNKFREYIGEPDWNKSWREALYGFK